MNQIGNLVFPPLLAVGCSLSSVREETIINTLKERVGRFSCAPVGQGWVLRKKLHSPNPREEVSLEQFLSLYTYKIVIFIKVIM